MSNSFSNSKAVIWDMDGVLIDSGSYHFQAWRETLGRERHVELTWEMFQQTFGWRNAEMLRAVLGPDITAAEIDSLAGLKEARFRELACQDGARLLMPGVLDCLAQLRAHGWLQAIASSAPTQNVTAILEALPLSGYFSAVVAAEDVVHGKPDPAPFLTAAQRLGVAPARCVVVEDAPAGIQAARRAGMACIGLLTTHAQLDHQPVFPTLVDVPFAFFERCIAESGGN
ncbi:MAG: HAD family phosphatase [Anaerolineae bacterium]|nr:HAD family phosphatase [Thermoflexales bacterium]MDW8407008.1 HAD family phosphatase [Anaerolineae bacterium]